VHFKAAITEIYPRILWVTVADPLGYAQLILRTTAINVPTWHELVYHVRSTRSSPAKCCPRHGVLLSVETFDMRKILLTLLLTVQFAATAWQFERVWPTVLMFSDRKHLQRSRVISGYRYCVNEICALVELYVT